MQWLLTPNALHTVALNNASRFMAAKGVAPASDTSQASWNQPGLGSSVDVAFRDRLLAINTPALADANKEGLRVMDHRLRPLNREPARFAGVARTVRCFNDFLTVRTVHVPAQFTCCARNINVRVAVRDTTGHCCTGRVEAG